MEMYLDILALIFSAYWPYLQIGIVCYFLLSNVIIIVLILKLKGTSNDKLNKTKTSKSNK